MRKNGRHILRTQAMARKKTEFFLYFFLISLLTAAQSTDRSLEEGFKNPPASAHPRTWWHWTGGNITKEGITKDLEWMKRAGLGGMQLADVAFGQGQSVEKKIFFGSPEWLDAVHYAASEADRLNLEMAIFSSAGWSLTGGPWVAPEQAMKKLVWSETRVNGPGNFSGKLPQPPSNEGPIRNLSLSARTADNKAGFYHDCVVLAFPTPADELLQSAIPAQVTTSGGKIDPQNLLDDDLNSVVTINSGTDKEITWIQYSFPEPVTIRSFTIAGRAGIPVGEFCISNDGNEFKTIIILPGAQLYRAGKVETVSFSAVTAKHFRFVFTGAPMSPADVMAETKTAPDSSYTFNEIRLLSCARINRWEDKAGFYHLFNYDPVKSGEVSPSSTIDHNSVIDLTSKMLPDGSVNWSIPEGDWTIMRFGWSLTGSKNRPAVPSGTGYEVDKLSKEHTEEYIADYMAPVAGSLGPLYGKSLRYVMLDSWEAGMQNWTENMLDEFKRRRGYDLTCFLPCLAGWVVDNSNISDRILWDFRRTLSDMFAENHYGAISQFLNRQGIGTYGEASGVSLEILEDALLCKKYVDIPMGEFWYRALHPELMYYQDVRGAASASHIYGKNLVAAEAFTGGGFESPSTLRRIGDYWFTQGINRIVFHTSAHQPLDTKPGNTMVGTHINRNITWSEEAAPFMTYLSRNSYMLQQGRFVADLVYLLDESSPSTMPIWGDGLRPAPPEGYDFDYMNTDALLNRTSVSSNGRITMPDGMSYAVMILPDCDHMTLQVLGKINDLVKQGATVIGQKPRSTPGYSGFPESETELKSIVLDLWGDLDGINRTRRIHGKGTIIWGTSLKTALEISGTIPDLEYSSLPGSRINWIHRSTNDADIFFLVNSGDTSINSQIKFRVSGKEAELWDPVTGEIKKAGYFINDNNTVVPVHFNPGQSLFVVFRTGTGNKVKKVSEDACRELAIIHGPWEITFPEGLGAPDKIIVDSLGSWTRNKLDGVKYFSGTATYKKTVTVPGKWLQSGTKLILDLGDVCDIAEVTINSSPAVILWSPPFRTDISGKLREGKNTLQIKVTNQWTNRLIGDQRSATGEKILNSPLFIRGKTLEISGLLGPVRIFKTSNTNEYY